MSNEQDMLIWKLDKDLAKARLALGKIYTVIDTVYSWNDGYAMDKLERDKVEEIAKTLQAFFKDDKGEYQHNTDSSLAVCST